MCAFCVLSHELNGEALYSFTRELIAIRHGHGKLQTSRQKYNITTCQTVEILDKIMYFVFMYVVFT